MKVKCDCGGELELISQHIYYRHTKINNDGKLSTRSAKQFLDNDYLDTEGWLKCLDCNRKYEYDVCNDIISRCDEIIDKT